MSRHRFALGLAGAIVLVVCLGIASRIRMRLWGESADMAMSRVYHEIVSFVEQHGRTPRGWDEVLLDDPDKDQVRKRIDVAWDHLIWPNEAETLDVFRYRRYRDEMESSRQFWNENLAFSLPAWGLPTLRSIAFWIEGDSTVHVRDLNSSMTVVAGRIATRGNEYGDVSGLLAIWNAHATNPVAPNVQSNARRVLLNWVMHEMQAPDRHERLQDVLNELIGRPESPDPEADDRHAALLAAIARGDESMDADLLPLQPLGPTGDAARE